MLVKSHIFYTYAKKLESVPSQEHLCMMYHGILQLQSIIAVPPITQ